VGNALMARCPWAEPSGLAAMLSGREGGRSGLKARKSWAPAEEASPGLEFGKRSPFPIIIRLKL
jgi:hypothetical protein